MARSGRTPPPPLSASARRDGLAGATLRDQLPMTGAGLLRCLDDGLAPTDWHRILITSVKVVENCWVFAAAS